MINRRTLVAIAKNAYGIDGRTMKDDALINIIRQAPPATERKCSQCMLNKPISNFAKTKTVDLLGKNHILYAGTCKACKKKVKPVADVKIDPYVSVADVRNMISAETSKYLSLGPDVNTQIIGLTKLISNLNLLSEQLLEIKAAEETQIKLSDVDDPGYFYQAIDKHLARLGHPTSYKLYSENINLPADKLNGRVTTIIVLGRGIVMNVVGKDGQSLFSRDDVEQVRLLVNTRGQPDAEPNPIDAFADLLKEVLK
jgi:hypothetical protein